MQPEIRVRQEKKAIYVRRTGNYNQTAGEAWAAVCKFGYSRKLVGKDAECIGIGHDDPSVTAEDKLRYDACITVSGEVKPEGEVGVQTIPGGRFAVFLHKGPYNRLNESYAAIYREWVPASGAKLRDMSCFELYLNDANRTKPENLRTEIWVPIE